MQSVHEYAMDAIANEHPLARFLTEAGGKVGLLGFGYLLAAVDHVEANPSTSMTKIGGVYHSVAERFGTTPGRVERTIRHLGEVITSSAYGAQVLRDNGLYIGASNGKLTNKELILQLAVIKKKGATRK